MAGKGSAPRPVDGAKFRAGWERVFWQAMRQAERAARMMEGFVAEHRKAKSPSKRKKAP